MKKIIVGISGASGVIMGYRLLLALRQLEDVESHLIVTEGGLLTLEAETSLTADALYAAADVVYNNADIGAALASGSFVTDGMIVMPCSMKSLAAIAHAYDENLLIRAADVCLKENRTVVLVPREAPLGKAHLRNMLLAADNGCTILPPVITAYHGYRTTEEQMDHIIGKALQQFGLRPQSFRPWTGMEDKGCVP